MGLKQSATTVGKLGVIYLLGTMVPQVAGLLLMPLYTRYIAPEQMDLVSMAARLSGPLTILIELGVVSAFKQRYFAIEEDRRAYLVRTLQMGLFAQVAVAVLILAVAGIWLAEDLLQIPLAPWVLFLLWVLVVLDCGADVFTRLGTVAFQLLERAKIAIGLSCFRNLLQHAIAIAVLFSLYGAGLPDWQGVGRQSAIFVSSIVTGAAAIVLVWRLGTGGSKDTSYRPLQRTGLTFLPHALSDWLAIFINGWLLKYFTPGGTLATYDVANRFPQLVQLPLVAFGHAAYPTLARLMSVGSEEAKREQARLYTILVAFVSLLILGVGLFTPSAILLLTAPAYHGAIDIAPILVLAWMFQALYWIVSHPVFYFGGGLWLSTATISSIVVNVALSVALIPAHGSVGAAWAMVGSFATKFIVAAAAGRYLYPLPWEVTKLLRILLVCGGIYAVDARWGEHVNLLAAIPAKLALFALAIPLFWLTGVVSRAEVRNATQMLGSKLRRKRNESVAASPDEPEITP